MMVVFGTVAVLLLFAWLIGSVCLGISAMEAYDHGRPWRARAIATALLIAVPLGAIVTRDLPGPYCPYTCRRTQMVGKVVTVVCDWGCARALDDRVPE